MRERREKEEMEERMIGREKRRGEKEREVEIDSPLGIFWHMCVYLMCMCMAIT